MARSRDYNDGLLRAVRYMYNILEVADVVCPGASWHVWIVYCVQSR